MWNLFLKAHSLWIGLFLFMTAVMTLLMRLNDVPVTEILYGIFLLCFLFLIVFAVEAVRYMAKVRRLEELENEIGITLANLPEGKNDVELAYQKLLAILMDEKIKRQNEQENRAKDFNEYFTLWVHQIKTPISAMRLLLQEKSGEVDVSEEQEELFRMEQYVEMALQYMRLDSESTDFVIGSTKLDPVIRESIRKYARIFIRRKIRLEYEETEEQVITDGKWLGFIIEQLLSNALKYTPEGSIRILVSRNCIVVEDTGIGINPEDLPRIFEKGYTGYNGHATQHSSGIGLYLSSRIAKKLSIQLTVESEIGQGTRVSLKFPEKKM